MKDVENMNEETGNGAAEDKKSVTLHALVLRTAAVSVAAIVIAAALLFSVVGCFAPAAYMRLYRSLGAYGIASVYAAEALDRSSPPFGCEDGGCAYITLASDAVEVTAVAFGDDASFARAERLVAACDAYLSADCGALHSAKMDTYYADVYASRPEILCTVYGYDAYVCGERMAALAVTDGEKAKSEAADIVASFGEEGSDAVRGITALASYAEYGDASAVADGARGIYDSLSAAADGEEDDFPKAFVRYKLYRLAAAMAGAGESGWAGDAEDAYGAWSATINAIKNV